MSEYTPTTDQVLTFIRGFAVMAGATADEAQEAASDWHAAEIRRAKAEALREVRSTIGAYTEHGVWAFDQAVACIERHRAAEMEGGNRE
ncbi:hypothetical protein MUN78_16485 [Leucobacter allii]|uniref:Antitoxin n=1 Tax=Leucobacter allii TaxID=2932247 RepID=A0ABY4FLQ8_9MICO|nr:hypothetical protein [Leucobacter allii]UOQ57228.1 hypothetical protein MUN78_16485 [Leucobacter allii]